MLNIRQAVFISPTYHHNNAVSHNNVHAPLLLCLLTSKTDRWYHFIAQKAFINSNDPINHHLSSPATPSPLPTN